MFTVGITGGIATGKSTATDFFVKKGIDIIDADEISRNLQKKGQAGYEAIIEKYKTVYNLIQELNENLGCLDNVKLKTTNGERKISKSAVKNIKEYLLKKK